MSFTLTPIHILGVAAILSLLNGLYNKRKKILDYMKKIAKKEIKTKSIF